VSPIRISIPLLLCSALFLSVPAVAGKIKCWKNSDGVRECGNVLPPEYAQKSHEDINKSGVRTQKHKRAATKEEIAAIAKQKADEAEAKRLKAETDAKDQILLKTFSSEDEITMTRNGKITTIKTEIRLTKKSVDKAKARLATLRKQAANFERGGKEVPNVLLKKIKQNVKAIEDYKVFINSKEMEQKRINTKADSDIARYRDLRPNDNKAINLKK